MYRHNGEDIFVIDGHMHFWDAHPENWKTKHGESWIKCFHAYHSALSPTNAVWPFEKFCRYGEEALVDDLFREGHVDMAILNSTYLHEFYKNGFNTHIQNNAVKAKYPDRFLLCGSFDPRDEEAGLRLFIGKANCVNCHNGPLFTDQHFHNTVVPSSTLDLPIDSGRTVGVRQAVAGEFNCTSRYSDAKADDCAELTFAVTDGDELVRAYKTPSLRNVAGRAPYMHAGQLTSLDAVLSHYNRAPAAPFGKTELRPLHLSPVELNQLAAFLRVLTTPVAAPEWLEPPSNQMRGDKGHVSNY